MKSKQINCAKMLVSYTSIPQIFLVGNNNK